MLLGRYWTRLACPASSTEKARRHLLGLLARKLHGEFVFGSGVTNFVDLIDRVDTKLLGSFARVL